MNPWITEKGQRSCHRMIGRFHKLATIIFRHGQIRIFPKKVQQILVAIQNSHLTSHVLPLERIFRRYIYGSNTQGTEALSTDGILLPFDFPLFFGCGFALDFLFSPNQKKSQILRNRKHALIDMHSCCLDSKIKMNLVR